MQDQRGDGRVERHVRGQQQHQQDGHRERQIAELLHHGRRPVDGAREVNGAGEDAEAECAERPAAGARAPRGSQADQQGYERDPREGGMPEPREAQDQQDAGEGG